MTLTAVAYCIHANPVSSAYILYLFGCVLGGYSDCRFASFLKIKTGPRSSSLISPILSFAQHLVLLMVRRKPGEEIRWRIDDDLGQLHFPLSDSKRLRKWMYNVRRKNWTPNENSRLCGAPNINSCPHHFYLLLGRCF
ncbi:hypothetical protein JOB18_022884 [Solea senegalensis]|uniref:Uncharacterized protein n=1 Tax=Solea senegalensis TaxID=28829 RepID=A0AAV6SM43_SOLSE|nr:hypothetical protein JOB18_022884 [Solea senegalensis]